MPQKSRVGDLEACAALPSTTARLTTLRFHLRAPWVQAALHLAPGRDVLQEGAADISLLTDRRAGLKNAAVGPQACMRAAEKRSAPWHGCARPRDNHAGSQVRVRFPSLAGSPPADDADRQPHCGGLNPAVGLCAARLLWHGAPAASHTGGSRMGELLHHRLQKVPASWKRSAPQACFCWVVGGGPSTLPPCARWSCSLQPE